jgi:hypothetical protein
MEPHGERFPAWSVVLMHYSGVEDDNFHIQPRLFATLANCGLLWSLVGADLAAGKFPQAPEVDIVCPLADQHVTIVLDNGDGDLSYLICLGLAINHHTRMPERIGQLPIIRIETSSATTMLVQFL